MYTANIQPETEVRGSLQLYYRSQRLYDCKLPMTEVEGCIFAVYTIPAMVHMIYSIARVWIMSGCQGCFGPWLWSERLLLSVVCYYISMAEKENEEARREKRQLSLSRCSRTHVHEHFLRLATVSDMESAAKPSGPKTPRSSVVCSLYTPYRAPQ